MTRVTNKNLILTVQVSKLPDGKINTFQHIASILACNWSVATNSLLSLVETDNVIMPTVAELSLIQVQWLMANGAGS